MNKKTKANKRKRKYIVEIEYTTIDQIEVKATSKRKAPAKAYEELCIDGQITSENVRKA